MMGTVNSVLGPVAEDELGITLTHEHIFINLLPEYRESGLLNDFVLMKSELERFSAAGGRTIVDLTPAELTAGASPDPRGLFQGAPDTGYPERGSRTVNNVLSLKRLAEETGVQIVLGTGHYREPYLSDGWLDRRGADAVAEQLVSDITEGISGTGVRAGIIGEIGADKWFVSPAEERSFRAAAKAHKATGAAVTTHAARWPVGLAQLDVLVAEGVEPSRIIIGHCDSVNIPEYHLEIARRGAYVQFDTVRGSSKYDNENRVAMVMHLVSAGLLERILISHDVCTRSHLRATGGCGYTFILTEFAAALLDAGLDKEEVDTLLVHNPRRALAG